jgi:predicted metalloprotease
VAGNDHPDVAVTAICAHEYGHILQFKRGLIPRLQAGQTTVKRAERQDQPGPDRAGEKADRIETDTDLIEFALADVALEDDFVDVFKRSRGKVDPDLKLGFSFCSV